MTTPEDVTVDAWREDAARRVLLADGTPYAETYVTKLREARVFGFSNKRGKAWHALVDDAISILNQDLADRLKR
jgi:hypothetical protein